MSADRSRVFVGTSNVTIPGNKTTFPDEFKKTSRLHYYAALFNSVEINSSFYKIPQRATLEKWTKEVGSDFRFTLKLHRDITHAKQLKFSAERISAFIEAAEAIGDKRGCLLIQFPGKINFDFFSQVEDLLATIDDMQGEEKWRKAVEFRNADWYVGETVEMLTEFNAAMVMHDIPKSRQDELKTRADFMYMRFHGINGNYRESYSIDHLKTKAEEILADDKLSRDCFVYFNNTIGDAFGNARTLKHLVE